VPKRLRRYVGTPAAVADRADDISASAFTAAAAAASCVIGFARAPLLDDDVDADDDVFDEETEEVSGGRATGGRGCCAEAMRGAGATGGAARQTIAGRGIDAGRATELLAAVCATVVDAAVEAKGAENIGLDGAMALVGGGAGIVCATSIIAGAEGVAASARVDRESLSDKEG
jgi:hypothetical protein